MPQNDTLSLEGNELHFCTSHLLTDDYYLNYLWHEQQDKTRNPKVVSPKPVTNHSHSSEQLQVTPAHREGCAGMACSNTKQMSEQISPRLLLFLAEATRSTSHFFLQAAESCCIHISLFHCQAANWNLKTFISHFPWTCMVDSCHRKARTLTNETWQVSLRNPPGFLTSAACSVRDNHPMAESAKEMCLSFFRTVRSQADGPLRPSHSKDILLPPLCRIAFTSLSTCLLLKLPFSHWTVYCWFFFMLFTHVQGNQM